MHSRFALSLSVIGLLLVGVFASLAQTAPAQAATGINQTVNFQGRLLNAGGAVVADGTYNMQFKIYQDGTGTAAGNPGGTLEWTEDWVYATGGVNDKRVVVKNGYFSVALGSVTAFGSSVDWNQDTLWLSMNVGNTSTAASFAAASGDGEMVPMRRLSSAVYALNAGQLGGMTAGQFAQLASTQTFTGTNTFQSTANATSLIAKQTSNGSPTASIFEVQTQNSTAVIQATGPAVNESALLLQSVGATRDLTINSGSGVIVLGTNVSTLRRNGAALSIDLNTASTSTLTVTNSDASNVANLSVEGSITAGSSVTATTTVITPLVQTTDSAAASAAITVRSGNTTGGSTLTTGAVTIKSGDGTGTNTSTGAITIDTGAKSGTGTTGAITIGGTNASAVTLGGAGNAAVTVQTAANGTIGIGTNAVAKTINIGSVGSTAANSTIAIGTSTSNVQSVTIGSTNSTSSTTIQGGTGNINLSTNSASAGVVAKSSTNSATAFQVLNASDAALLTADTSAFIVTAGGTLHASVKATTAASAGSILVGSSANQSANDINGTIGFYGTGTANAQIAHAVGDGFYLCNSSTNDPAGDYGQCTSRVNLYAQNVDFNGTALFKNTADSATALRVQNAAGSTLFNVNSSNNTVSVSQGKLEVLGLAPVGNPAITLVGTGGTLANSTTYRYRVAAYNAAGQSEAVASTPTSLTTVNATSHITMTWGAVTGATGYYVYRSIDGGTTWFRRDAGNVVSYDDTGALTWNGTDYASADITNTTSRLVVRQAGQYCLDATCGSYLSESSRDGNTYLVNNNAKGVIVEADSFAVHDTTGYNASLHINSTGATTFKNRLNSAAAFQIQDIASAALLTADTATRSGSGGNLLKVGNSTGTDGATTILQVDAATANPTTNLAALNGGLFYNSTTNKLSVIENGAVKVLCNATDLGCGAAAGNPRLDQITAATAGASINNGGNNIVWNWQLANAETGMIFGENVASTGGGTNNQFVLQSSTLAGSTASPLSVVSNSVDAADVVFNLNSAGDIQFQDAGTAFLTMSDAGAIDITLDATDNPSFTITNAGTGDVTVNQTSGNFIVNDNAVQSFKIDSVGDAYLGKADGGRFVFVGDGTSSASPNMFLLDQKGTTGDPANLIGAMYYNAFSNKFRCNENNVWMDCVSTGAAGANTALSNLASVAINTALGFQANQAAAINFAASAATTNALTISGQTATGGAGGSVTLQGGNTVAAGTNGTVTIDAGSGATTANGTLNLGNTNTSTIAIGTGAQARTINIGATGAAGAVVQGINIGTNSTAGATNTVTIGNSAATASTVTVNGGTGASAIALQTGASGTISIGANAVAKTINIGSVGSTAANSTVAIGTSTSNVQSVTIGSTSSTSSTTVQGGTGNINLTTNSASASIIAKSNTNSTTAFQIQNASSSSFFTADSINKKITTLDVTTGSPANTSAANRLFSDNFETNNFNKWTTGVFVGGSSTVTMDTATVRNGKYAARFSGNNGAANLEAPINGAATTVLRGYFNVTSQGANSQDLLAMYTFAGDSFTLYRASDGTINIWNGVTSSGSASGPVMTTGVWHKVELVLTVGDGTAGSLTAYLDDAVATSIVSTDTNANNPDHVMVGDGNTGRTGLMYADDVVADTVRPGDSANVNVADSLHVSGSSTFAGSLTVNSGVSGVVQVGSGTTNASANLLVLDSYNVGNETAFDEQNVNGAMYYNTSLSKFRCRENGAWGNCIGGSATTLQDAYNASSSPATITTTAAKGIQVVAGAVPTADMMTITNAGQPVTAAGVNALSVNFVGGAAAVEAAGMRVDFTPGTTSGGTWSGLRIVAATTGAVSGVTQYGIKLEGPTTPGAGTEKGVYIGTGWDIGMDVQSGGIQLAAQTDPAAPAANNLRIYAKDIAGRIMPKWIGPAGVDTPMQPNLGFNRVAMMMPAGGAVLTSFVGGFGSAFTNAGTANNPTPASTNLLTSVRRATFSTGATLGTVAYHRQNVLQVWRGNAAGLGGFFYTIRFGTSTLVAGNRAFVGLSDTIANPTNVDPTTSTTPGKLGMAINANTGNWRLVNNITGTAPTSVDLGANFPVNTTSLYELIIYASPNSSSVNYRVQNLSTGNQTSGSWSTNIPSATTFMAPNFWITNNATGSAAILDFSGWYLESDN